jgi:hypothetical protein
MRRVDDDDPVTLSLALGSSDRGADRFIIEVRPGRSDLGPVTQRIPLPLPDEQASRQWFHQQLLPAALAGSREDEDPAGAPPLRVTVPGGLVESTLRLLAPHGSVTRPPVNEPSEDRWSPTAWIPTSLGPGIISNEATGEAIAYERIDLFGMDHDGWTRSARSIDLQAVGGPRWPLRLLRPPVIVPLSGPLSGPGSGSGTSGTSSDDRRDLVFGSEVRFETTAGVLRCRAVSATGHHVVSRVVGRIDDVWPIDPPLEAVAAFVRAAARASAGSRRDDGSIDLETFRAAMRGLEAIEVLVDRPYSSDEALGVVAVRYRMRDDRSAATVRVFGISDDRSHIGWLDANESLARLAERAWTPERTIAIRPELLLEFDSENVTPSSWLATIAADGVTTWRDVPSDARRAALEAATDLAELMAGWAEDDEDDEDDEDTDEDTETSRSSEDHEVWEDWITRCRADLDTPPPMDLDAFVRDLRIVANVEHALGLSHAEDDEWER